MTRGEALAEILAYRYRQQEWRIAYVYRAFCVRQFLNKPPKNRYWIVDHAFYTWRILRYHLPIVMNLRKRQEAETLLSELQNRLLEKNNYYTETDYTQIKNLLTKMKVALREPQ